MASQFPFRPLSDKVVVRPIKEEKVTVSGIIVASERRDKTRVGEVVAVGRGRYEKGSLVPMSVKPGDRVVFGWLNFDEFTYEGEDYLIMAEPTIILIKE